MEFYTTSRNTGRTYSAPILFARNLKSKLSELVKGKVFTDVRHDTLYVTITSVYGIEYIHSLENLTSAIVHGYTSDQLAQEIVKRYNTYIRNLFFL